MYPGVQIHNDFGSNVGMRFITNEIKNRKMNIKVKNPLFLNLVTASKISYSKLILADSVSYQYLFYQ